MLVTSEVQRSIAHSLSTGTTSVPLRGSTDTVEGVPPLVGLECPVPPGPWHFGGTCLSGPSLNVARSISHRWARQACASILEGPACQVRRSALRYSLRQGSSRIRNHGRGLLTPCPVSLKGTDNPCSRQATKKNPRGPFPRGYPHRLIRGRRDRSSLPLPACGAY